MFSVDRLVKCRTISGSANSGRAGGLVANAVRPATTRRAGTSGTSLAGKPRSPARPGLESSNSSCVARVLRIGSPIPVASCVCERSARPAARSSISARVRFSVTVTSKQVGHFRIPASQRHAGKKTGVDALGHELVDVGRPRSRTTNSLNVGRSNARPTAAPRWSTARPRNATLRRHNSATSRKPCGPSAAR